MRRASLAAWSIAPSLRVHLAAATIWLASAPFGAGCAQDNVHDGTGAGDAAAVSDLSALVSDGPAGPLVAAIAFSGCPVPGEAADAGALGDGGGDAGGGDAAGPRCGGRAPLTLTLVPVVAGAPESYLWTLAGATPATSQSPAPTATWSLPGTYRVDLVVGGAAGQASASAVVEVRAASTGEPCAREAQCESGLACVCGALDVGDGGPGCEGALAAGLCTRACVGGGCGAGEWCVDLARGVPGGSPRDGGAPANDGGAAAKDAGLSPVDGGANAHAGDRAWREALCLPTCAADADCAGGFVCRDLPALSNGASEGGAFTWQRACFARVLGDVGDACVDANGQPDDAACTSGYCAPLGARGQCSIGCESAPCPTSAVCATFSADPTRPLCLPRCDPATGCGDPLLACQPANAVGGYGFTVPKNEPNGATYCAPKRCASQADCGAGRCVASGAASFCAGP